MERMSFVDQLFIFEDGVLLEFTQDHLTWHNLMEDSPLGPMVKCENSLSRGIFREKENEKRTRWQMYFN